MVKVACYVGKHPLDLTAELAEHWALGFEINDKFSWYELPGVSKSDKHIPNKVSGPHSNTEKYKGVEKAGDYDFLGTEQEFFEFVTTFNGTWEQEHPEYELNGDNCQKYVSNFLKRLGFDNLTQNSIWGRALKFLGAAFIVVGAVLNCTGATIQGSHEEK